MKMLPNGRATHKTRLGRLGPFIIAAQLSVSPVTMFAQAVATPPVKTPVYDAVSIKLNKSGATGWDTDSNTYRYSAKNISLKNLMEEAYGLRKDLISGVDGPVAEAHFDIEAKIVDPDPVAVENLTEAQRKSMLIGILLERFRLTAHTESKLLPVFQLEVAKDGPKFKASASQTGRDSWTNIKGRELDAHSITMVSLASTLTYQVHRTVIDKTGLAAMYDLKLTWSSDDGSATLPDAPPLIFTSLKEQLGLKLEPAKGPVQTLVVDHVEMPSEN